MERYARAIGGVNLKIFSVGATFGAFAVFALTGLYPTLLVSLITVFFWPALVGFSIWFLVLAAMLTYNLRWDRFRHRWLHIADGYAIAFAEHVFLFIIVALDSYLLTPGAGRGPGAFFNPTYWPELGHRFVGNISWASFFIAAVAVVYSARTADAGERRYFQWAAKASLSVGFLTLMVQVALGAVFVESIKAAAPDAFQYSMEGSIAWLWIVQSVFLALLLVGSNLYFVLSRAPRSGASTAVAALVMALGILSVLPAGVIPRDFFWVRYLFLALAMVLSLGHFIAWRRAGRRPQPDLRRSGRWVLGATGVTAMLLFLLMGVIRTSARGDYAINGRLTDRQGQQQFQPPNQRFYP
jgi:hypothetical protein